MVTFGTSVWRFSEIGTSMLGVGNLASSAMTSELFRFFLLKKFNIVVDLLMIYKFKKKKKCFIISIFCSSIHQLKKGTSQPKKKKSKTKIITNRPAQVYI